jgi:hypothetical protein
VRAESGHIGQASSQSGLTLRFSGTPDELQDERTTR